MRKNSTHKEPTPDADSPEWTDKNFSRALRFSQLPESLQRALSSKKRGERGQQKAPTKVLISLRLSPDVLQALRGTGPGWQTRADQILRGQLLKEKA